LAIVFLAVSGAAAAASGAAAAAPRLVAPDAAATATRVPFRAVGFESHARVRLETRRAGGWRAVRTARAGRRGRARLPHRVDRRGRRAFRARAGAAASPKRVVRVRDITLAAVGDINLGDGPRAVMRSRGVRYPWRNVAPTLRRADVAFGNLECAVSRRGRPVPKQYNFRGGPRALRAAARFAGLDVVNLANNHTVDYGRTALLDTIRFARRYGLTPVGAGRDVAAARRPRIVRRLGLRIAFVGFSDRLPLSFFATPRRPGTSFASVPAIRRGVRRARRQADVVVATFHWGDELVRRPTARQRLYARTARRAGATAVIGAHPHVLQPWRRHGRGVVAYSLGNFIWTAGSGPTSRTGILTLRMSGRGIEGARFAWARIVASQPRLRGPR
jgi:poly-gamma-glutamate synthesis protein (capsule biosynthesis protein)